MDAITLAERVERLRRTFSSGKTRSIEWRRAQLKAMRRMFVEREDELAAALKADLHKSTFESYATEIGFLVHEIDHALGHLDEWTRRRKTGSPVFLLPSTSRVIFEPLGVALILGAWNYPLQLTLGPLVAAIAAGNAAVIKPPRTAKAVFETVGRLLPEYLDPDAFLVIADDTANDIILAEHWDKIFFTGSAEVGRVILQSAVKNLTPVTLELGGKSPAMVEETANLTVAAHRIAQGKFFNAGQTCVAPDYILAQESILPQLVKELTAALHEFYGDDPQASPEYARIINTKQFDALVSFMPDGEIACGGKFDRDDRYIAPTVLTNVSPDSPVMRSEIFGPILPVLAVKNMDEAVEFVNKRDKPLAFYIFSENRETIEKILNNSSSGGVCVNETMNHLTVHGLPFGGVGKSGMGKYHGEWDFRDFSNARALLDHSTKFDPALRYPPYEGDKLPRMKKLLDMKLPNAVQGVTGWLLSHWGDFILKFIK